MTGQCSGEVLPALSRKVGCFGDKDAELEGVGDKHGVLGTTSGDNDPASGS